MVALNFGVFLWLAVGVMFKRRRVIHAGLMTSGFALDTTLLLYIELSRQAVNQLFAPMGPWLIVHIINALFLVFLYPALLFTGGMVSAGASTRVHKKLAISFLVLRLLLVLTAWLAVMDKPA